METRSCNNLGNSVSGEYGSLFETFAAGKGGNGVRLGEMSSWPRGLKKSRDGSYRSRKWDEGRITKTEKGNIGLKIIGKLI